MTGEQPVFELTLMLASNAPKAKEGASIAGAEATMTSIVGATVDPAEGSDDDSEDIVIKEDNNLSVL
jgi:hypothetical protein